MIEINGSELGIEKTDNKNVVSFRERIRLWFSPAFNNKCSPSSNKGAELLHRMYHSVSGVLELIGYPSPRRHEKYFVDSLNNYLKENPDKHNPKILMLGAMSPSSIADILEVIEKSNFQDPELTVIDICRTPLASGKSTIEEIAKRFGIKINLVQADINTNPFKDNSFDIIIGDQILNFIDPENWPKLIENLLSLVTPKGQMLNIIATYKKELPYFGKTSQQYIENLINKFSSHRIEIQILNRFQLSYVGLTGIINDQTALKMTKTES